MMTPRRRLEIAAVVETATVLLLFGNLLTIHTPGVSALAGPTHGMAYLTVIALAFSTPGASALTKWSSVVPLIGGWLSVRALSRAEAAGTAGRTGGSND